MTLIVPSTRPRQTEKETRAILSAHGITDKVALQASRGYYKASMGDPRRNDRGMYDDAIFLVSPSAFVAFNANTDPSVSRPGIAVLRAGVYRYKVGTNGLSKPVARQYTALVQAGPVTVDRDGRSSETGFFGINVHRGSTSTTSSLGCQTIHPTQWEAFISLVRDQLARCGQKTIPYVLIEV